ncbi:hypothetical protein [Brachybacterium epidermidis]|uniref:hypothetical protein n=1 Tax=Brachybacterium epidermidis TaxID=2781983 RepID=UPI001D155862|nr:hypothetical protein [Brachybacterium epidermidis]
MTSSPVASSQQIRLAVLEALSEVHPDQPATEATLYTPQSHHRALRLDASLVVGGRGTGKTFWTSALRDESLRSRLGTAHQELDVTDVRVGHAEQSDIDAYPDPGTLAHLLDEGFSPYEVWRAVVHGLVAPGSNRLEYSREDPWPLKVARVRSAPEDLARDIESAQKAQAAAGRHVLLVFDALDRTSSTWDRADEIARDLLRTALWFRPFRNLHIKVFLREDQYQRAIHDFADASKLKATEAKLAWRREDLHGLLWQRLINTPRDSGSLLRELGMRAVDREVFYDAGSVWQLNDSVRSSDAQLRKLFAALAGSKMGTDHRRGNPYTWVISHLADGNGDTSPRSLLTAMRSAAEDSAQRYADNPFPYALHYESIKRGIGDASRGRVNELSEDYPWVNPVARSLSGSTVPLDESAVIDVFSARHPNGPVDAVREVPHSSLPPEHVDEGWPGIIQDLLKIGVLTRRTDDRIDMPDLYRIGYEVKRKGGVAPPQ